MAAKVTGVMGLIPLALRIEPAVDKESSGNRIICLGTAEKPHDPARVEQRMTCPVCEVYHSSYHGFEHRGRELGDTLVVLTDKDLAEAGGAPRTGRAGKPPVEIKFHPREKVYRATVAGDSVQNVYPDRGGEKAYALLRDHLEAAPDVVACMIWAPSTANALWTIEVVDDRLVATKRAWPEYVKPTQAIPPVEISQLEREMFMTWVDATVEDFDLSVYSDQRKLGVEALIAERAGQGVPMPTATSAAAGIGDLLAGLEANIAAVKAKTPAKKAVAKKAPAKRAAAKKTTTPRKKVA